MRSPSHLFRVTSQSDREQNQTVLEQTRNERDEAMSYGQTYADDMFAINASESARAAFMRRTYIHLFGAILAFIGIEALFFQVHPDRQIVMA